MSRIFRVIPTIPPSLLALVSGGLVVCAFYIPYCWFVAFIALVPLFIAIDQARGRVHAFVVGLVTGVVIVGGTSLWIFYSVSGIAQGNAWINFGAIVASWLAMIIVMAPLTGLFSLLVYLLPRRTRFAYLVVPFAWVVFESLRMYGFFVVTFSSSVYNPPFYSNGFIGYPLADSVSWLQFARLGGIYLLSFFVAFVNYLFFRVRQTPRKGYVIALVLLLISCIPLAGLRQFIEGPSEGTLLHVGIISNYIPESERAPGFKGKPLYHDSISESVEALAARAPDFILLPEGARFLDSQSHATSTEGPLVIDLRADRTLAPMKVNAAFFGTIERAELGPIRAKQILTPQGEYVVGLAKVIAPVLGVEEQVNSFARAIGITPAYWGSSLAIPGTTMRASVMFCIEMIAPGFGARLVEKEGSQVLFSMVSHGSFKDSYVLGVDTLRFLKMRTVEAQVPSVSSADEDAAYALDRFGRVTAKIGGNKKTEVGMVTLELLP